MSGEIAFDSNRVGHRTQRVFHATWCEMNGHVVSLTPTTAAEIAGSIRLWDVAGSVERLRQEWTQRHNDPTLTKTERYDLLMQQWWGIEGSSGSDDRRAGRFKGGRVQIQTVTF